MARLMNPVLLLLVISSSSITFGEDGLSVKIVNPGGATTGDTLHLVYEQVEVVICQITNADKEPVVQFGFVNATQFPITNVTSKVLLTDNKYDVNVTLTFNVTGQMNREYLSCKFDNQEWKAYIELYFPPLLTSSSTTIKVAENEYELYCETISVPETQLGWTINGLRLDETRFANAMKQEYGCKQVWNTNYESNSYKYRCRSNLTLVDLSKEDIGSNVSCSSIYQGKPAYVHEVTTIDYSYNPENITVVARATKGVNGSINGTIELTCTTSPANPEPQLHWYRGSSQRLANRINTSAYPVSFTEEDKYKGRIASQTVHLSVNKEVNGETYLCCVYHLTDFSKKICGSTDLIVPWLSDILAPQMDEYTFYVGSNVSIPCSVDSNPEPLLMWSDADYNWSDQGANNLVLNFPEIKKTDSGKYICKAILRMNGFPDTVSETSKTITINLVDAPEKPQLSVIKRSGNVPDLEIDTASTAPEVPQSFYIQYKKSSESVWVEISQAFSDTLPGQASQRYMFDMSSLDLRPGDYHVRVKALSQAGLVMYTDAQTFQVKSADADKQEMVEKSEFNAAIVVSVLVTAAVFIILIVAVVCLFKRGACK